MSDSDPGPHIASLIDDVRALVDGAREAGGDPRHVALGAEDYDAVFALKTSDLERGIPMMLLGMEIVRADDPLAVPRVF